MLHVLGLSFGKRNANSDILCKEALYGVREAFPDAEIKFINTQRLKIDRCIGCGACSGGLEHGKDNKCVIKDDFQMVESDLRGWNVAGAIFNGSFCKQLQRIHSLPQIPTVFTDCLQNQQTAGSRRAIPSAAIIAHTEYHRTDFRRNV